MYVQGKFILNEEGQAIFIGAKDLTVSIPSNVPHAKDLQGATLSVKQLQQIAEGKGLKKKVAKSLMPP